MPTRKDGTYFCKRCGWENPVKVDRCRPCKNSEKRAYLKAHPEKRREQVARYRRKYPEKLRAKRVSWKKRNRDSVNATARKWLSNNPDLRRAKERVRREFYRAGDVVAHELRALVKSCDSKCHYCGVHVETRCLKNDPKGFDHVIPFARGGKHTISNIVVSCWDCNVKKGTKDAP